MNKPEPGQNIRHPELRFGYVADLYYTVTGTPVPKQLDLLNDWFPSLIITEKESNKLIKEAPEYIDTERMIHAVRYHNYLYSGGNNRITHITGKLVGTASSNLEKERKTAELIQKNIARKLVNEMDPLSSLVDSVHKKISRMEQETLEEFHYTLYMFCLMCAEAYYEKNEWERDTELFPFDDEVFDQIIYNAFYQLQKYDYEGLLNAWLWLLCGSLLRNECGRICRTYDSSFVPLYKAPSETGHLLDKLRYLLAPEEYESIYTGDELENRFPGIEWYCDHCNDHLNEQEGFTDHLPVWQCRKCGYLNPINAEQIYETAEDRDNNIHRKTEEDLQSAIARRKEEKGS